MSGGPPPHPLTPYFAAMFRDGLSAAQIRRLTGLSEERIRDVLRRAGLSPKDRGIDCYDDWMRRIKTIQQPVPSPDSQQRTGTGAA